MKKMERIGDKQTRYCTVHSKSPRRAKLSMHKSCTGLQETVSVSTSLRLVQFTVLELRRSNTSSVRGAFPAALHLMYMAE